MANDNNKLPLLIGAGVAGAYLLLTSGKASANPPPSGGGGNPGPIFGPPVPPPPPGGGTPPPPPTTAAKGMVVQVTPNSNSPGTINDSAKVRIQVTVKNTGGSGWIWVGVGLGKKLSTGWDWWANYGRLNAQPTGSYRYEMDPNGHNIRVYLQSGQEVTIEFVEHQVFVYAVWRSTYGTLPIDARVMVGEFQYPSAWIEHDQSRNIWTNIAAVAQQDRHLIQYYIRGWAGWYVYQEGTVLWVPGVPAMLNFGGTTSWDESAKQWTASLNGTTAVFTVGSTTARVTDSNGKNSWFEQGVAPFIHTDDHIYLTKETLLGIFKITTTFRSEREVEFGMN